MPPLHHSSGVFRDALRDTTTTVHTQEAFGAKDFAPCLAPTRFGHLFPQLQNNPDHRLPPGLETVQKLTKLGLSMRAPAKPSDSAIPSAYTYFGQFIAHDLALDPITRSAPLCRYMDPFPPQAIRTLKNPRTGLLDIDSVYGPAIDDNICFQVPRNNEAMKVAFAYGSQIEGTDLPRSECFPYEAKIGDRRNDENLITSQLHLAFLRAHNKCVKNGATFAEAQALVRRRYQYLVVEDYLPKFVSADDLKVVRDARKEGKKIYSPENDDFFMPIEFTGAAFRFGHAMIRSRYAFNKKRPPVSLSQLFTPNALGNYFQILDDWVIDWSNFIEGGPNFAQTLLPQLVEPLSEIIDQSNKPGLSLAVRDLLRGHLLGLPTGQAVAIGLGLEHLKENEVLEAATEAQRPILEQTGFHIKTPLWFYIFAEANHFHQGARLGPVCGQVIASVLLELEERTHTDEPGEWNDIFGKKDNFNLSQFLLNTLP